MMSEREAPDVIFAEIENVIEHLQNSDPDRALKTLLRVRGTIAAHALQNTNADVGSEQWRNIINVLLAEFP